MKLADQRLRQAKGASRSNGPVGSRVRLLVPVILALFLTLSGRLAVAGARNEMIQRAARSCVRLSVIDDVSGNLQVVGSGSGTIISNDGAILTNYHVIADMETDRLHAAVRVERMEQFDRPPIPVCVAVPKNAVASRERDLAVIRCEMGLDGAPYRPADWPALPIGDPDALQLADRIWVLGYPAVGGATINLSAGVVSGVQAAAEGRDWFKTDALVHPGNSGGSAVNDRGQLIGIPTGVRTRVDPKVPGELTLIRPADWATDLIDRAGINTVSVTASADRKAGRPRLGVKFDRTGRTDASGGAVISELQPEGPAEKAALQVGDVIAKFEDQPIHEPDDLSTALAKRRPGDVVHLTVRRGQEEIALAITLGPP